MLIIENIKPRPTRVRNLRGNDLIVMDGAFAEVCHAHFCNGQNEPTQFIGNDEFKTTIALRVFLTDGTSFLAHPDSQVLRV